MLVGGAVINPGNALSGLVWAVAEQLRQLSS